jgi:hypothetical protein
MRLFCELLPHVTRENWRQVLEGFEAARRSRGEGPSERYQMMLEHVAMVAGADALDDAVTPEKIAEPNRFALMLKAWSESDPKAAVAWYRAQSAEFQNRHLGQFISGLSRTDPKTALELAFKESEGFYAGGTTTNVVRNAVNLYGVKGAEDIFNSMSSRSDIPQRAKAEFFKTVSRLTVSRLRNSNDPAGALLNWYEPHLGRNYVSSNENSRIIGEAAKLNPGAVMAWLEGQNDRLPPSQSGGAFSATARELQGQSPQQLSAWIAAHPEHPQRDNVVAGAADTLVRAGDLRGAMQIASAITDVEKRAELIEDVQRRLQPQ